MQIRQLVVAGALVGIAGSAQAHHAANPHYDLSTRFTLEGVVTELKLVNPHGFLYFDVTADSVTVENWRCSLSSANRMKRRGWDAQTLQPGQKITIAVSPARREEQHCFLQALVTLDGNPVASTYNEVEEPGLAAGDETTGDTAEDLERVRGLV